MIVPCRDSFDHKVHKPYVHGLQVNGGGGYSTSSLLKASLFRNFKDVLRHPLRYVHIFSITYIITGKPLKTDIP